MYIVYKYTVQTGYFDTEITEGKALILTVSSDHLQTSHTGGMMLEHQQEDQRFTADIARLLTTRWSR